MRSQHNYSNRNRGRYGRSGTSTVNQRNERSRGYARPYEADIYEREYTRYPESDYYSNRGTSMEHERGYQGRHEDDRNIFERAGDTIREKWNDWTDRDRDSERYENNYRMQDEYETQNRFGRGTSQEQRSNQRGRGRNVVGRLGRRVREAWDDLTDRDYEEQQRNYGPQNRYNDENRRSQVTNRYGRTRRYTDTW